MIPRIACALSSPRDPPTRLLMKQSVHYVSTADQVSLAWASLGRGMPLVKAATWLTHLQYDLESPIWSHWVRFLAGHFRYIRYDGGDEELYNQVKDPNGWTNLAGDSNFTETKEKLGKFMPTQNKADMGGKGEPGEGGKKGKKAEKKKLKQEAK